MGIKATERDQEAVKSGRAALDATLSDLESHPESNFHVLREHITAARSVANDVDAQDLHQRARLLQANMLLREGKVGDGGRLAEQIRAWAQDYGDLFVLARAHRELYYFHRLIGQSSDALTHAVQCLVNLPDATSPLIRVQHLSSLALALHNSGSISESARYQREALTTAKATGDSGWTLRVLNNMAFMAYETGDEPAARRLIDEMRATALRSRPLSADQLDTIARVEMMSGRFEAAELTLGTIIDGKALADEGDIVAECLLTLAELRRECGRYAAAQTALDEAVRESENRGLVRVRSKIRREQADLYAATGRHAAAYREYRRFHVETIALDSIDRESRANAVHAVFEVAEARRMSDLYRDMAYKDALTGLFNRRYVNENLQTLLDGSRAHGEPLSVAIADLDLFKRINDTLSHEAGDTVLQKIGELLLEGGASISARLGGEEFVLVFAGADMTEAVTRCEQLRLRISRYDWAPITGQLPVTMSIGVTTYLGDRCTSSGLLSRADRNLYIAKRQGRDRVVGEHSSHLGGGGFIAA